MTISCKEPSSLSCEFIDSSISAQTEGNSPRISEISWNLQVKRYPEVTSMSQVIHLFSIYEDLLCPRQRANNWDYKDRRMFLVIQEGASRLCGDNKRTKDYNTYNY